MREESAAVEDGGEGRGERRGGRAKSALLSLRRGEMGEEKKAERQGFFAPAEGEEERGESAAAESAGT